MLLTECIGLRDARTLLLRLWGILADLALEGHEEVLAKLLWDIHLQVRLHEEPEALIVNGLWRSKGCH